MIKLYKNPDARLPENWKNMSGIFGLFIDDTIYMVNYTILPFKSALKFLNRQRENGHSVIGKFINIAEKYHVSIDLKPIIIRSDDGGSDGRPVYDDEEIEDKYNEILQKTQNSIAPRLLWNSVNSLNVKYQLENFETRVLKHKFSKGED